MPGCGFLYVGSITTFGTCHICVPTNLGTSGSLRLMLNFIVSKCFLFHVSCVITSRTSYVCVPTDLGTGGCLRFMLNFIVSKRFSFRISCVITSRTSHVCVPTNLGTGGCLRFMLNFIVSQSFNQNRATYRTAYIFRAGGLQSRKNVIRCIPIIHNRGYELNISAIRTGGVTAIFSVSDRNRITFLHRNTQRSPIRYRCSGYLYFLT